MTGRKAGFWLGTCQNDVKGVRLSSRNAPIRDLVLPLFPRTEMPDQVRHDGKGGKTAKMGTDRLLTSVPVFREERA